MSDPTVFDPRSLPRRALAALHAHRAALTKAADGEHEGATLSVRVGDGDAVDLPPALARVVAAALAEVADGHAVEVRTVAEELTTQEAADLLGVSRPFVVKLVDGGQLPARRVGTHRRVRRADVLAHRERMRATTAEALQQMSDDAQALGLYGADPRMPGAEGPPSSAPA
ncbi:helix-turn-helix domain-containing protein [Rubrivirga sp. S365]|uniref:helix-turn-helix domain-containing protein n=1 Tax=Rubrivirga sp. S365 TaxID=3076080 RepID=UPI0028C84FA3|nr:helix-turn-helix domain-containing protein [Rubrivirga sp. S365]MDT7858259.1 helix-turn-helix domain-containing protein [Rubrivirga sp. S365]